LKVYKDLGFNKQQLTFLIKRVPNSLVVNSSDNKNDVSQLINHLQKEYKFDIKNIKCAILRNEKLFVQSNNEIEEKSQFFQKKLGLTKVINFHRISLIGTSW
jgi:uncharacterized protein YpuA (DUF1002 family)